MRIFFLAQRVPFPPDRGDKITTANEVRHLARSHEVHVFCLADGPEDAAQAEPLRRIVASVTAVPVAAWPARLRATGALLAGRSLTVAMLDEAPLRRAVAAAAEAMPPDLIFVYSSNVAQHALGLDGLPRIMQFADLDSRKFADLGNRARWPMRLIYALEGRRLLAWERRIAHAFSHSLLCTEAEVADFRALIPGVPVSCVGNGVDLDYFVPGIAEPEEDLLVFTGVMDYSANVDAMVWFCAEVLPRLRTRRPAVRLAIVGSRPNAAVRALGSLAGVTVTGRVPDVRPWIGRAAVFVAPLRLARGIQNKVLEAMASGVPVVASTAAWSGTGLASGDGIVPAGDAETFAARVTELLEDPARRAQLGARGRAAMERDFTWAAQLARLDAVIAQVAAR
ncbi:MAG: TIGR03087 family PEP-CTERM/XrtA system glycosyltransferase [Rhodospirillales bacterium]|nr:TIGR03087 family PEP-CTERM/XrtA system glycosyltransferase [Rhodospirillales bacterium]